MHTLTSEGTNKLHKISNLGRVPTDSNPKASDIQRNLNWPVQGAAEIQAKIQVVVENGGYQWRTKQGTSQT